MGTVAGTAPSAVEGDEVVFRLPDPEHACGSVSVWSDVDLGEASALEAVDGGWELRLPLPDLDCVDYLFDVDGALVPDPANPDQVDGPFGAHSWLALPGYEPPAWLAEPDRPGTRAPLTAGGVDVEVWEPEGHEGAELPLLLVHDGAEMDAFGGVVRYAATRPPMRVALLSPGDHRDERYAASTTYAATLVAEVLPALAAAYATRGRPVLLGQSLGGLAALHAGWLYPGAFAGLALQSGSFFTPVLDPQESGYALFDRVVGFVASVHESTGTPAGFPPVVLTCGTAEENLANNRLMHTHLLDLGADAAWGEVRQGHTWTCWRDSLHPHLTGLLERAWA